MNKLPRAVLAAGVATAAYFPAHDLAENYVMPQDATAVNEVQLCANAIVAAKTQKEFLDVCNNYRNDMTPTAISPSQSGNRSLTYRFPTQIDFLNKELPNAALQDQDTTKNNSEEQSAALFFSLVGGAMLGAAAYGNKYSKKIHMPSLPKRKKPSVLKYEQ